MDERGKRDPFEDGFRYPIHHELTITEALGKLKSGMEIPRLSELDNNALTTRYRAVKGDEPLVAFSGTGKQRELPNLLWGIPSDNLKTGRLPSYVANVEGREERTESGQTTRTSVTARIIFDDDLRTGSEKEIFISKGLEKRLSTDEGDVIRISDVHQNLDSLNFDDRYSPKK